MAMLRPSRGESDLLIALELLPCGHHPTLHHHRYHSLQQQLTQLPASISNSQVKQSFHSPHP